MIRANLLMLFFADEKLNEKINAMLNRNCVSGLNIELAANERSQTKMSEIKNI